MKVSVNENKIRCFCSQTDMAEIHRNLRAFEEICNGTAILSPIAKLDIASRFRWLTATRSTVVQSSKVHPGLCSDPTEKLDKLFAELVL